MTRRSPLLGMMAIALFIVTACGTGGGDQYDPTETVDQVLTIVTLTPVPSATTRSEMVEYMVAEGDTLSGIADEFDILPAQIVEANGLPNPDAIFVGQTLNIPAPAESTPIS